MTSVERSGWFLVVVGLLALCAGIGMQYRNVVVAAELRKEVTRAHLLARRSFGFADDCAAMQLRRTAGSIEAWTLLMPVWPQVTVPEYLKMPESN